MADGTKTERRKGRKKKEQLRSDERDFFQTKEVSVSQLILGLIIKASGGWPRVGHRAEVKLDGEQRQSCVCFLSGGPPWQRRGNTETAGGERLIEE